MSLLSIPEQSNEWPDNSINPAPNTSQEPPTPNDDPHLISPNCLLSFLSHQIQ